MASPNDLVLPKVPANNEIEFLSEYVLLHQAVARTGVKCC